MESGLVGRNNTAMTELRPPRHPAGLNGVRPSWPEQYREFPLMPATHTVVSMESGLVGRNNPPCRSWGDSQSRVSMESGLVGRNNVRLRVPLSGHHIRLNGVRPSWPEQSRPASIGTFIVTPSQWSPA